jgi:hypothetical protein
MTWAEYPPSGSSLRITVNFRPFALIMNRTDNADVLIRINIIGKPKSRTPVLGVNSRGGLLLALPHLCLHVRFHGFLVSLFGENLIYIISVKVKLIRVNRGFSIAKV